MLTKPGQQTLTKTLLSPKKRTVLSRNSKGAKSLHAKISRDTGSGDGLVVRTVLKCAGAVFALLLLAPFS
jgi:hypothetical protein